MGDAYYIGNMRRAPRRVRPRGRHALFFLCLLLLSVFLLCRYSLYPYAIGHIESESKNRLTAICSETIGEIFAEEGYSYDDLIRLTYTAEGRVASASVNTAALNLLRSRIAKGILAELKENALSVRVPLSNLFGIILLSSSKGGLNVTLHTAESIISSFSSHFEECGINQTKHLITFDFSLEVYFLLPLYYQTMTLTFSIAATETLIVGEVPDSFTDIERLTDSVEEYLVDDAVDFGNVVN